MVEGFEPVSSSDERAELTSVLTIVGFACFWAWFIACLIGSAFYLSSETLFSALLVRLVALATMALTQLVVYLNLEKALSEFAATKRLLALIIILAFPVLTTTLWESFSGSIPLPLTLIAWASLGVSMSLLLLSWGSIWSSIDKEESYNRTTAQRLAWAILIVALLSVVINFSPLGTEIIVPFAIYLASAVLQTVCSARLKRPDCPSLDASEEPTTTGSRMRLFSKSRYTPLAMGGFFGASLAFLFSEYGALDATKALFISVFIAALVAIIIIIGLHRVPKISTIERILFPLLCACFLVAPFVPPELLFVVIIVTVTGLTFYFLFHWNILIMVAYKHDLLPMFHFSQGALAPFEGLAIGWGLQTIFIGLGFSSAETLLPSSLFFAFATTLIPAIGFYKSNTAVEALSLAEDGSLFVLQDDKKSSGSKGVWKQKCFALCEAYGLSPRETEVFFLLAKGRNAEYIHNELFISVYTAKTHGYRIYRKLNVHSQQELIDMVEQYKLTKPKKKK